MDQNATDLMMKFELDGSPVWAECALDVDPNDKLMLDFNRDTGYDNYTNFFEVTGFDFGIALKENEASPTGPGQQPGQQSGQHGSHPAQPAKAKHAQPFARWRSATEAEYQQPKFKFPLEFDQFNFERTIDSASPIFFLACCGSKTFNSVVLVKRISLGDISRPGEQRITRPTQAYLRIDFTDVMITGIDWDDGDLVKEKCEFICKSMEITYRKQTADGALGDKIKTVWPNPNDNRPNMRNIAAQR